jgi:hypothetical protein
MGWERKLAARQEMRWTPLTWVVVRMMVRQD